MALIIEDGTIVANANSYASHTDLADFANLRGIDLTTTQEDREALLIKAMDKLAEYRGKWKGCRVSSTQELDFPRSGIYVDGQLLPSGEIPRELFYGQMQFALTAADTELQPVTEANAKGPITEETVHGAVTRKYANPGRVLSVAADSKAETLIRVLLRNSGLEVVRK